MTTLKNLLYAGAFAAVTLATPAMAANNTFDLGTIEPGTTYPVQSNHAKTAREPAFNFTDTINFNLAQSGQDGAFAYFNFASRFSNISNAMLTVAGPVAYSANLFDGFSKTLYLASGNYTATISGRADGSAGGSYTFGITAPTPEPEIWLSLVAGAGMAGFMARRRKQATKA